MVGSAVFPPSGGAVSPNGENPSPPPIPPNIMASRAMLPSDPAFLRQYMNDLPCESDSDDEFEGYLGAEDGPVAYRSTAEDEATLTPTQCSLGDLATTQ